MQQRCRSIARWTLVAAGMALVLAACRGGEGTTQTGAPRSPDAATSEPRSQVDPLEGEWRAEYTCEDSLRAIERSRLSPNQIRVGILRDGCCPTGSLHSFMGAWWGGTPTEDDPCRGATKSRSFVVRFEEGTLEMPGDPDVQGVEYELLDDHTIGVTDPSDNVCPPGVECRWEFERTGDELTFDVGENIHGIMFWESAPFQRIR
jgi:hypothetical protein